MVSRRQKAGLWPAGDVVGDRLIVFNHQHKGKIKFILDIKWYVKKDIPFKGYTIFYLKLFIISQFKSI